MFAVQSGWLSTTKPIEFVRRAAGLYDLMGGGVAGEEEPLAAPAGMYPIFAAGSLRILAFVEVIAPFLVTEGRRVARTDAAGFTAEAELDLRTGAAIDARDQQHDPSF
jgi:hypothetical protein